MKSGGEARGLMRNGANQLEGSEIKGDIMNQPKVEPIPGRDMFGVTEDYSVVSLAEKITVPEFFITDGASIPMFAWQIMYTPFHPDVMAAAVVHDWLYTNHQCSRKMADLIFKDILIANGVDESKADLMYKAVRIGGRAAWKMTEENLNYMYILRLTLLHNSVCMNAYKFPDEVLD